jgi:hypothetical protein
MINANGIGHNHHKGLKRKYTIQSTITKQKEKIYCNRSRKIARLSPGI